jgi:hypothetical protein
MRGGRQTLNLQNTYALESGCFRLYTIVHEFLHALGFYHMQSATERDDYVRIVWKNIQPGAEHNFNTYPTGEINQFHIPYDYGSVMHYSKTAFTVNGKDTIVALNEFEGTIGQRYEMSQYDIQRVNNMYCVDSFTEK